MAGKTAKPAKRQFLEQNPVESFLGIGKDVVNSFTGDFARDAAGDFWNQVLGGNNEHGKSTPRGGDLQEGQEISLSSSSHESRLNPDIAPGLDYRREILYGSQRISKENNQEIEVKVHEILIELKKLVGSSKELEAHFKNIVTPQQVVQVGKYHLSFFQFMLTMIRETRLRIEDSASWLQAFQSKKSKKNYWSMFKKHGTTFGLSNERTVATQTG